MLFYYFFIFIKELSIHKNLGECWSTPLYATKNATKMPKLNDTQIERLKHKSERYDVRDTVERGLVMRVGKKAGSKIWHTFIFEKSGGKSRRRMVRLGQFPVINTKAARIAAIAAKSNSGQVGIKSDVQTLSDLFKLYKEFSEPKRRSWRDVQNAWDVWANDRIGHLRLTDISAHHARDLRNHVSVNSSELRGNAVIRYIRPMFKWAVDDALMLANPWANFTANVIAERRDRTLNEIEWQAVWDASFEDSMGEFFRFLMLSGQRKGNVSSMRWDEIEDNVWIIPKDKMKATRTDRARAHEVPLTYALLEILRVRPRVGEFVFGMSGSKPLSFGSRQKDRIGKKAGITEWRVHDIRRTAGTMMTKGGVSRFVMQRVRGHAETGAGSAYDTHSYRSEKLAALEVLSGSLGRHSLGNVVVLSKGAEVEVF
jgi:integrase